MTFKFGLHINSQDAIDSGWVQKFNQSPVHLVLADSIGTEIGRTAQVAELCPNSLVIYRAWHYGWCESDHFDHYYSQFGSDPIPLINAHQPVFDALRGYGNRIVYQFFNETGMDDLYWPRFVDLNTRLVKEMSRRGLSCSIFGAGPGFPTGTRDEIWHKWDRARPIFDAINSSAVPTYINLHEYIGFPHTDWKPFLCGRYKWLLQDLAAMGLLTDRIKIIAGENGWANPNVLNPEYPSNPANGYRGYLMLGVTPEQLADDLGTAFRTIYDPDPHFVGSCHFSIGRPSWPDFDLMNEQRILERIYQISKETPVIDTDVITFRVVNGPLRKRVAPSLSALYSADMVVNGTKVDTNGYIDAEGYRWRRLVTGEYSAEYDLDTPFTPFMIMDDVKERVLSLINSIRSDVLELEQLLIDVLE